MMLRSGVLFLQLAQPLGVRDVHPTELAALFIKSRIRDTILTAQIDNAHFSLGLSQHFNNLLFGKSASFQSRSLQDTNFSMAYSAGEGHSLHTSPGSSAVTVSVSGRS